MLPSYQESNPICIEHTPITIGALTTLNIRLSQFKNIKCKAKNVRLSKSHGKYPDIGGL